MQKTVIINLKHYRVSSGPSVEKFLSSFIRLDTPTGIRVIFAINPVDLRVARSFPELEFYSQHSDPIEYGAYTGQISIEALVDLGITGTLLNHSEKRIKPEVIGKTMTIARRQDFPVVICSENLEESVRYSELKPEFIAYEPPELIGGYISVTTSKPEIVEQVVRRCSSNGIPILVGAGVKNGQDAHRSIELGASGILVASGIVLSNDPFSALNSLIERL